MTGMTTTRSFRLLTLAAAAASWALVAVGGVVRVTESGLGCPDWPLCKGNVVPKGREAPIIEYSHRATATIVIVLVLLVAAAAFRRYRDRREIFLPALAAALLVPFQALLGAVVVWLELPASIVGVHFVVGMVFLATIVFTAAGAWRAPVRREGNGFVRLVWVTFAAGLALVSVGAAVVSAHADDACGERWPSCNGGFASGGTGAAIQVAHRSLAYVVAVLALALAVAAWRTRGPRLAASLPLAAVLGQTAIGITLVVVGGEGGLHQALEGLHVGGAGAVWASVATLAGLVGLPRRRRAGQVVAVPVRAR